MTPQDSPSPRALSGHTPTPWVIKEWASGEVWIMAPSDSDYLVGKVQYSVPDLDEQNDANAEFIVRAVNSHQALVEALSDVLAWIDEVGAEAKRRDTERLAPARALALAEGSRP